METTLLFTIVPPIFAGIIAYAIARRKAAIQEAKIAADAQSKAMETAVQLVSRESHVVREELRKELDSFRKENQELRDEVHKYSVEVETLRNKLFASDELIGTLRAEISALKRTIDLYEAQIQQLRSKA